MARAPPAQSPPRAPPRAALGPHASAPAGLDFLLLLLEREQERGGRGAAPGRALAGSLEPEPRIPAPLLPSPLRGSHPGRRRRRPERGAGQTAHGRALVPAWCRICARSRGFRRRAPRSREPRRAQSSPSSASRPCLEAESPASRPQCVWLGAWHRHPDPRGQRGQKALSPPSHPALGVPESISQCPSLQRDAALPHEPAWRTLPGTCLLAGRRGVSSLLVGLVCDGRECTQARSSRVAGKRRGCACRLGLLTRGSSTPTLPV